MRNNFVIEKLLRMPLPPATAWKYRVEGAQKMVFALTASVSTPPLVLSLYLEGTPGPEPMAQPLFRRHLSDYIEPMRVVKLSQSYLNILMATARPERPAHRDAKYVPQKEASVQVDELFRFGTSSMLVEIKPKCAVQSRSRLVPPEIAQVLGKFTTPTYHIKEYLCKGNSPEKLYYPADLLSGDAVRVQTACDSLVQDNSTGVRVFLPEGETLQGNRVRESSSASLAIRIGVQVLTESKQLCDAIKLIQAADVVDILGADIVMKELQRRIGNEDAESSVKEMLGREGDEEDSDFESAFSKWTKKITYESSAEGLQSHIAENQTQALETLQSIPSKFLVRLVSDYLEAAAAKDCSILISMAPENTMGKNEIQKADFALEVSGTTWRCRALVIDIGKKGIDRVTGKWPKVEKTQYEEMLKLVQK